MRWMAHPFPDSLPSLPTHQQPAVGLAYSTNWASQLASPRPLVGYVPTATGEAQDAPFAAQAISRAYRRPSHGLTTAESPRNFISPEFPSSAAREEYFGGVPQGLGRDWRGSPAPNKTGRGRLLVSLISQISGPLVCFPLLLPTRISCEYGGSLSSRL